MPASALASSLSDRETRRIPIGGSGIAASIRAAEPGEQRYGTSASFEAARVAFEAAWRDFLPKRSEADFKAWRDQEAWTAEKYRRFDRHERMPQVLAGDG